jgi:hypothetical protein
MAKAKNTPSNSHKSKPRKKRKGVHAKTKSSRTKSSRNYKKPNAGQGR